MIVDNTEKFSGKARVYEVARPDYAAGLITYIVDSFGVNKDTVVADIG